MKDTEAMDLFKSYFSFVCLFVSTCVSDELCVYVKTEMKMRGFVSKRFHELPNDMSTGSRELLLSFGWLMCRSTLIDLFMEQCCLFLDGDKALVSLGETVGETGALSFVDTFVGTTASAADGFGRISRF